MENKCQKAKWLSEEALQTAVKWREAKSKGEKERYSHLNAEFQSIARRDKKAFFSDQCKEIEENNRMGKTRDLFKKIRDTKGTFHTKMGSIKDRNGMDLREDSLEKTLMLGGIGGRRRRGRQRLRWIDCITDLMGMSLSKLREFVMDREAWHAVIHGVTKRHDWTTELNWTELLNRSVLTLFSYMLKSLIRNYSCISNSKLHK